MNELPFFSLGEISDVKFPSAATTIRMVRKAIDDFRKPEIKN